MARTLPPKAFPGDHGALCTVKHTGKNEASTQRSLPAPQAAHVVVEFRIDRSARCRQVSSHSPASGASLG